MLSQNRNGFQCLYDVWLIIRRIDLFIVLFKHIRILFKINIAVKNIIYTFGKFCISFMMSNVLIL